MVIRKLPVSLDKAFSITLFLSAALLFAVQPMLGKMLLPLVGGAPSGWLTALAFFQIALLAGYYAAHLLARLPPQKQAAATLALLIGGILFLPPGLPAAIDNAGNIGNVMQVLLLLLQSIALPYLALSTVSSGLQRLYGAGRNAANHARDPYFLYAASNAGSFAGLLTYPILVEPFLPLQAQSHIWTAIYVVLIAMIGVLLLLPVRDDAQAAAGTIKPKAPAYTVTWRQRLTWMVLAFVPSSLSMGLTALVTTDIGSLPLFWVVPLALYLLTFVIAFARGRRLVAGEMAMTQWGLIALILIAVIWTNNVFVMSWGLALVLILAFFVTALMCHMEVVDRRPGQESLTEFYLWLAVGGALGGCFNAFLTPLIFPEPIEFILLLSLSTLLQPWPGNKYLRLAGYAGLPVAIGGAIWLFMLPSESASAASMMAGGAALFAGMGLTACAPRLFAVIGTATMLLAISPLNDFSPLDVKRDFFGVIKIVDARETDGSVWRRFMHGSTLHGKQRVRPAVDTNVASYYTPLRIIFDTYQPKNVGILGLGAGVMLCLKAPGRHFTVYEIGPLVREAANQWFTFIRECGEPEWRIGDGRLELQREPDRRYDLLVMDAFSSDSIPMHLVTREAVKLYFDRLTPQGILVFNISNRYYDLRRPLAALAHGAQVQAWTITDTITDYKTGRLASMWVVMASGTVDMQPLADAGWRRLTDDGQPVWRDDFANILSTLFIVQQWQQP